MTKKVFIALIVAAVSIWAIGKGTGPTPPDNPDQPAPALKTPLSILRIQQLAAPTQGLLRTTREYWR